MISLLTKNITRTREKKIGLLNYYVFFFVFTVIKAKHLSDDKLKDDSSIVISAGGINGTTWPRNREGVIKPSVVLSKTVAATLPKGEQQCIVLMFTWLIIRIIKSCPWILQTRWWYIDYIEIAKESNVQEKCQSSCNLSYSRLLDSKLIVFHYIHHVHKSFNDCWSTTC